jgi:hypothetical protein
MNFNLYPEKVSEVWAIKMTTQYPPEHWKDMIPAVQRHMIGVSRSGIDMAERIAIADNATSREDFHDYAWHISEIADWGACLCELRIITGEDCLKHLEKGSYEPPKVGELPKNKHWAWYIDSAPRGMTCPRAQYQLDSGMGNPPIETQACEDILIKPPPEHWVLAQRDCDPNGTVAGRASTDIVRRGSCLACAGLNIQKHNRVVFDQQVKLRPTYHKSGKDSIWKLPLRYTPSNLKPQHPTLVPEKYYYWERLNGLFVPPKDMYDQRRRMTVAAIQAEAATEAQAAIAAAIAAQASFYSLHGPYINASNS